VNQRPEIFITLNHKTPKASLEQVAMCLVRAIEAISKRRLQPLHANGEITLRRFQGNVVVITECNVGNVWKQVQEDQQS